MNNDVFDLLYLAKHGEDETFLAIIHRLFKQGKDDVIDEALMSLLHRENYKYAEMVFPLCDERLIAAKYKKFAIRKLGFEGLKWSSHDAKYQWILNLAKATSEKERLEAVIKPIEEVKKKRTSPF